MRWFDLLIGVSAGALALFYLIRWWAGGIPINADYLTLAILFAVFCFTNLRDARRRR